MADKYVKKGQGKSYINKIPRNDHSFINDKGSPVLTMINNPNQAQK